MNSTVPGLFRLIGEDSNDLTVVLPQPLIEDLDRARAVINDAILESNRATRQGFDGAYFDDFQSRLAKHGIQILAEIENLRTRPWDSSCNDELGDMVADATRDGFVQVVVSNICDVFEHQDEDRLLCMIEGDATEYAIDPKFVEQISVVSMEVEFPRSDRYGVPECSTDRGGRRYLKDFGLRVPSSLEVQAVDSGDDTPIKISLVCRLPRQLLVPIQADSEVFAAGDEPAG